MIYTLVHLASWPKTMKPSWYIRDGDKWRNSSGGYCFRSDKDKIIKRVEAADWDDLNWMLTGILVKDSNSGWLSRRGKFYGCHSTDHDLVAYRILKSDVENLEKTGWVRVFGGCWKCAKRLSAEQRNWLQLHSHILYEDD